jgi:hypothetical protein
MKNFLEKLGHSPGSTAEQPETEKSDNVLDQLRNAFQKSAEFALAWYKHFDPEKELFIFNKRKVVSGPNGPIMTQHTLLGLIGWHVRIHHFHLPDEEGFHDHPRHFASICLRGSYAESFSATEEVRIVKPGDLTIRKAETAHNVQPVELPCSTLAVTTPVIRKWNKFKIQPPNLNL